MPTIPARSHDRGDTLIELIFAIAILGVCVVGIGTGIAMSVRVSSLHRAQATAQDLLHTYAETAPYTPCSGATLPDYTTSLSYPADFNPPTATVKFWDATSASFSSTTCPASDPGLQQVDFRLTSKDGLVTESLLVVLRSPS